MKVPHLLALSLVGFSAFSVNALAQYSDGVPVRRSDATAYDQPPVQVIDSSSQVVDSSSAIIDRSTELSQVAPDIQNSGDLFMQVQALQQEVMALRGIVEQQAQQLRELNQIGLDRYIEVDKRIASLHGGAPMANAVAVDGDSPAPLGNADSTAVVNPATGGAAASLPNDDIAVYQAAFKLVREQQYDEAIPAFLDFLAVYPDSQRRPNVYYWLGAVYMLKKNVGDAENYFSRLLSEYGDHPKVPDAMFKLASLQFSQGKRIESRELLDKLIANYDDGSNTAVQLAKNFLRDNFPQ